MLGYKTDLRTIPFCSHPVENKLAQKGVCFKFQARGLLEESPNHHNGITTCQRNEHRR